MRKCKEAECVYTLKHFRASLHLSHLSVFMSYYLLMYFNVLPSSRRTMLMPGTGELMRIPMAL